MSTAESRLATVDQAEDQAAACNPRVYVSNEEAALLTAMRKLREKALEVRENLSQASDPDQAARLRAELESLRVRWHDMASQREGAWRRKMIMLGHLEPDADDFPVP